MSLSYNFKKSLLPLCLGVLTSFVSTSLFADYTFKQNARVEINTTIAPAVELGELVGTFTVGAESLPDGIIVDGSGNRLSSEQANLLRNIIDADATDLIGYTRTIGSISNDTSTAMLPIEVTDYSIRNYYFDLPASAPIRTPIDVAYTVVSSPDDADYGMFRIFGFYTDETRNMVYDDKRNDWFS